MPKEQPTITSTVRYNGVNYASGQEDELEAAGMSKAEIQRLTDKGAISGFGSVKVTETAAEGSPTPVPASTTKAKSK